MKRQLISSGSPYEIPIGFSRAVRVGNVISVAGTGPISPDGSTSCPGDAYGQAHRCLDIIKEAIEAAGARINDVVRTRLMLTDVSNWKEVARAHGEFFGDIRPASTLVEISRLVQPAWLVEIKADCVITDEN